MSAEPRLSAIEPELTPKASLTDEEKLQLVAKVSADAIYDWDLMAGMTRWNRGLEMTWLASTNHRHFAMLPIADPTCTPVTAS